MPLIYNMYRVGRLYRHAAKYVDADEYIMYIGGEAAVLSVAETYKVKIRTKSRCSFG